LFNFAAVNEENADIMEYNEKQVHIIEVTEKLIAAKGYVGTSIRDIAHEAGVNLAMISYYFGSKEKLFEALFIHRIASSRLALESLLHNKEYTSAEKIDHLIDNYVGKMMMHANFHRITLRDQMSKDMKSVSELVYENKRKNMEIIQKIVQEGQKRKEFVKHVDVPMLITTMIGTFHHLLDNQHFYRLNNNMEDMSEADFHRHLFKKLSTHLKHIFKAILTYEGK